MPMLGRCFQGILNDLIQLQARQIFVVFLKPSVVKDTSAASTPTWIPGMFLGSVRRGRSSASRGDIWKSERDGISRLSCSSCRRIGCRLVWGGVEVREKGNKTRYYWAAGWPRKLKYKRSSVEAANRNRQARIKALWLSTEI